MSWGEEAQDIVSELVAGFGERSAGGGQSTVTHRRPHTLRDGRAGGLPVVLLQGVHASGASILTMDAANLEGVLPQGIVLTITGVSGTYTTTGPKKAVAGVLTAVGITPSLAGAGADNAVVTVGDFVVHSFDCAVGMYREEDLNDQIQSTDRKVYVDTSGAVVEWTEDDIAVLDDGVPRQVALVRAVAPDGTVRGVVLTLRT